MVFGVNDESQISNLKLFENNLEYLNQIIKIRTNKMNEESNDSKVHNTLKGSSIIYIYGMSLGETDKLWWDRICIELSQHSDAQVIIHAFDAPEEKLVRIENIIFEDELRDRFVKYSDLDKPTKNKIKNRIHVTKANIFSDLKNLIKDEDSHISENDAKIV